MAVYRHHGKWRYDFWKFGRRHKKGGFQSKEKAKIAEAEARKSLKRMNSDFISLCESRLKDIRLRRTDKYFKDNLRLIKKLIPLWGKRKEITRDDVEDYLNEAARKSHFVANKELRFIKALFNHALQRDWLSVNPAARVKKFPVAKAKRYIPPEEDIKKVLWQAGPLDRLYLLVIAHTLGRISAVNQLKWEDVKNHYVILRTRKAKNSDLKEIAIPMNRVLAETIKQIPRRGEYVFMNPLTGKPYDYRSKFLKTLCKKAGVKVFTYHCLRHFGASKLDSEGVPLSTIQQLLGHERATTTDLYLQSLRGSAKEAVKKLEDLVTPKKKRKKRKPLIILEPVGRVELPTS